MTFFVAIHQEAWPARLDELLATIRRSLAAARTLHPERRSTRLFQRLGQPTQLLALSEWTGADAFEQFRQWPVFVDTIAACGPPPRIEMLEPVHRFERMEQRVTIVACSTVTVPAGRAQMVEAFLLSETHRQITDADGLVSREVYRARTAPGSAGRLLLVHSWRSIEDLDRFRSTASVVGETALAGFGARVERFTGALAAEFSTSALR